MREKFCPDYCGLACVNGTCPQIENKRYRCDDCWFYEGCEDCYFKGTDMCGRKMRKENDMAQYIDLDKLLKGLEDELKDKNPNDIAYLVFKIFICRLSQEPTADVVPKSAVDNEIKVWQELYADTVSKWEKAYEELEIKLENAKAEVAREIFEELRKKRQEIWSKGNRTMFEAWCEAEEEVKKKYIEEIPIVRDLAEEAVDKDIQTRLEK